MTSIDQINIVVCWLKQKILISHPKQTFTCYFWIFTTSPSC